MKKNITNEEYLNENSDKELASYSTIDSLNDSNKEEMKEVKSNLDDSNSFDDHLSENDSDHSATSQIKSKSNKRKKLSYGSFEILKDKCKPELKNLKIVLAKFDKNIEKSDNISPVVSNNLQTTKKLKPKKSLVGPLSVKLARQKKELEQNCLDNNLIDKLSNTTPNPCDDELVENVTTTKASEKIQFQNDQGVLESSLNKTIVNESSVGDNRPDSKKPRPKITELDKLHADISEMYDCAAILNVPNVRHCRTKKQIDYANNSTVFSKKNKTASSGQLNSNEKLNCDVDKKLHKKPKLKLQKTKNLNEIHSTEDIDNTGVISQKSNNLQLVKNNNFKSKELKIKRQVSALKSQLNGEINETIHKLIPEELPKTLTKSDFIDTLYFQTANNLLECKFCDYSDNGINIVRHYKEKHCKEEVLPSRLPKNRAESLIKESFTESFGSLISEDYTSIELAPVNCDFTCIFCELILYDIVQFYDHITFHTGEYRYKCKSCEQVYSNENELENHIIEHPDYNKFDGISHLLYPNPIHKLFGYLCPFCYYVQLDYNNMVEHMKLRHFNEDTKSNGRWTVIRVSMSLIYENCKDSDNYTKFDFTNLVGCLPPIPYDQKHIVLKDKFQNPTVSELITESKMKLIVDVKSLKQEIIDQPEIDRSLPKNSTPLTSDLVNPSHNYETTIEMDKTPSQIENLEYTLKENTIKCTVANLSCQLMNSLLLYKCSVSGCLHNPFSTVFLADLFKHIELNHKHIIWDRKCSACTVKLEKDSEECYVEDALKHLVSHHLVLRKNKQCEISNPIDFNEDQYSSNLCQDTFLNTEEKIVTPKIKVAPFAIDPFRSAELANPENTNNSLYVSEASSVLQINDKLGNSVFINNNLSVNEAPTVINLNNELANLENTNNSLYISEASSVLQINDKLGNSVFINNHLSVNEAPIVLNSNNESSKMLTNDFRLETIVNNVEQSSYSVLHNPLESSDSQININQISDYDSCPNSLQNVNVISSNKETIKNKLFKANVQPNNDNLSMWLKVKLNLQVVQQDRHTMVDSGLVLINDGKPLNNAYRLIGSNYKKCYLKKIKELPLKSMKTRLALNEMTSLPRLLHLFKCLDRTCTKTFTQKDLFKLHMELHFSNADKKKKNQLKNTEQFKKCAYCFKSFDDVESLANHIEETYAFCHYFCPYCFYRAYTPTHVLIHLSQIHEKSKPKVLTFDRQVFNENVKETLKTIDMSEFILPYVCNIGSCIFSCYLHEELSSHLMQEHLNCDTFCCYICDKSDKNGERFFVFQPKLMIKHFKLHGINKYQCVFCLFGTEVIDSMLIHLAMEHFEYNPLCLERSPILDDCDTKNLNNLKILNINIMIDDGILEIADLTSKINSLPEILPQRTKKRRLECPDVLSAAMKSAHIDENSQSSDAIVITVPDRTQMADGTSGVLVIDNEFIMLDDANQTDVQEAFKLDDNCNKDENNSREPQQLSSSDIIIIDDDDDDEVFDNNSSNKAKNVGISLKQKHSTSVTAEDLNKVKRLALPLIALDKLFFCKKCNLSFPESKDFLNHQDQCSFLKLNGRQCGFCSKSFKSDLNLAEHLKLHGPDRFKCSSCNFNAPSKRAIVHHMKLSHKIIHLDFVPVVPDLNDLERNEFIVYENKTVEVKSNICFTCEECSFKANNQNIIISHMNDTHNVHQYDIHVITEPTLINNFTQEYLVKPLNILNPQEQRTSKRKNSIDHSYNAANKRKVDDIFTNNNINSDISSNNAKILLFSPDTIDSIPRPHVFQVPIGCKLCSYNTKVRSNLLLHLNGHIKGQDNTTKEIVNPVPSIGKSELMFDKMINLSASSFEAMNTEKMKIDEINKKIIEVAPPSNLNLKIYPQFIPQDERYKCSMLNCDYTSTNVDMLKTHIKILHSTYECYTCPHCPNKINRVVNLDKIEFHLFNHSENLYGCQYCDYTDFNCDEMRAHMRSTHLFDIKNNSKQSNIIVIRKTMLKDYVIDRVKRKEQFTTDQWMCKICLSDIKYTLDDIKSHIFNIHNISKMFKCPMCQFEHDDYSNKIFEEHYRVEHPSVAVKFITVFEKVADVNELNKQVSYKPDSINIQEQQALESIEPTLVPPTCRGIPVDSSPSKTGINKIRSLSKSPKTVIKNNLARKQKILVDNFNINDDLGQLSPNGLFLCPRCNVFETMNIEHFREHLYKDVNYKTWKCLKCFEISDSPKKMAWHVKKHGDGSKYEKMENLEKSKWVDLVIAHQYSLLNNFKKKSKERRVKNIEQSKSETSSTNVHDFSLLKINDNKNVQASDLLNDEIINLVDDSDDE